MYSRFDMAVMDAGPLLALDRESTENIHTFPQEDRTHNDNVNSASRKSSKEQTISGHLSPLFVFVSMRSDGANLVVRIVHVWRCPKS